jgi:hypothetical protein
MSDQYMSGQMVTDSAILGGFLRQQELPLGGNLRLATTAAGGFKDGAREHSWSCRPLSPT